MRRREPDKAKLVVSMFSGAPACFGAALERLIGRFGPADFLSETLDFGHTGYYGHEFGRGLKRKMASFEELVSTEALPEIKIFTNSVEDDFLSPDKKRRINIDPGYLTLDKLVLASCKNFSHRIHLGKGVYSEITLIYSGGGFNPLPWTYPDYREPGMGSILKEMRRRYAFKMGRGL